MNESEFEAELRALRPAAPSPALEKRIAAEMPSHAITVAPSRTVAHAPAAGLITQPKQPSALLGLLRGLLWAGAGAAVATFILLNRTPQAVPTQPALAAAQEESVVVTETADETVSELIESTDEGLIYDQDAPARQMRYTYLERHFWTNPRTGAVIEFEVPREDIVLMPVAMQ